LYGLALQVSPLPARATRWPLRPDGWRAGLLYAEDREREEGDCNAGCDDKESIRDVAHGIPRRPKRSILVPPRRGNGPDRPLVGGVGRRSGPNALGWGHKSRFIPIGLNGTAVHISFDIERDSLKTQRCRNERCRAKLYARNRSVASDRGGMSNPGSLLRRRIQKGTREPWNLLRLAEARGALVEHSGSALALAIRPMLRLRPHSPHRRPRRGAPPSKRARHF
jgi:hypothetical protein